MLDYIFKAQGFFVCFKKTYDALEKINALGTKALKGYLVFFLFVFKESLNLLVEEREARSISFPERHLTSS